MKTILLSLSLLFAMSINAQSQLIAVPTPARDTLFLINQDIGYFIKKIWNDDKVTQIKPVLVMVDQDTLYRKQNEYYIRKKSTTITKKKSQIIW